MKITCNGLDKLVSKLEKIEGYGLPNIQELPSFTTEIVAPKLLNDYKKAQYDGVNDVSVRVYRDDKNTYILSAEGQAVCYIEFGAGTYYNGSIFSYNYPFDLAEFGIDPIGCHSSDGGTLSKGINDTWKYQGALGTNGVRVNGLVETHGNPANKCLYNSGEIMKTLIKGIMKKGKVIYG